jgi:hypothetical protein
MYTTLLPKKMLFHLLIFKKSPEPRATRGMWGKELNRKISSEQL